MSKVKGLINSHWYPKSLIKKWGASMLEIYNTQTGEINNKTYKNIFATKAKNEKDNAAFNFYEKEIEVDEDKMLSMFTWKRYQLKQEKIIGTYSGVNIENIINENKHTFPIFNYLAKYLTRGVSLFMMETTINFGTQKQYNNTKKSINDMTDEEKMYHLILENFKYDKLGFKDINFNNNIKNMISFKGDLGFYAIAILTIEAYAPLMYPPMGMIKVEENQFIYFLRISPGQYILIGKPLAVLRYLDIKVENPILNEWNACLVKKEKFTSILDGTSIYQHFNLYQIYDPKKIQIKFNQKERIREIFCMSSKPENVNVIWKFDVLKLKI